MTGVAYIQRWTKNERRNDKSLYFVVNELKIMPKPRARPASIATRTGSISAYMLGRTREPEQNTKYR